ncbi:c(7)-type cytochrome triheme domain-containing protein [Geotalea toluenoxydans]|uniref:c(7)-type cytochrome triheme domain-containing protein n=1 Tax=Geotalea toluenoxydans TaxID=421624 RepID=UPI001FB426BE|nr:c(7)-type cytochrome triheme domain-containing protein [Geotalea toluenoxydans]
MDNIHSGDALWQLHPGLLHGTQRQNLQHGKGRQGCLQPLIAPEKEKCKNCQRGLQIVPQQQSERECPLYHADMDKGKSCGMCHNGAKAFALSGCTSCHKVRQITYNVKETGPTTFSHSAHLKTMQCSSCHNTIFKPGPNKRVNMAEMEKGKSCGACHDGKKSFALSKCTRCHPVKDRSYKIAGAGNVEFSHAFHLEAYGCKDCHAHLYSHRGHKKAVTMAEMEKGKSCGACHDSKTAFTVKENCDRCHKV